MKAVVARYPKTKPEKWVILLAYGLASILILVVVAQLMTFEKFIPIMQNYQLPGGSPAGKIVAGLIVIGEVFALPFLLRMRLSPLMRLFSLFSLILVALLWLFLGLWVIYTAPPLIGTGILGGLFHSLPGWTVLIFGLDLFCLSALMAWLLRDDVIMK